MIFARVFWPLVGIAVLAACSGNLGGGQSTLPGTTMQNGTNPAGFATPAATATPVSASNVATVGDSETMQALPAIAGWGGTIAFAKTTAAPSATPNPKATSSPADAAAGAGSSVSVGITASIVEPSDAPHLGSGSKHRGKHDTSPDGLLFISLLATSDVAFAQYPKIAVNVPREIVAKHRVDVFALALYDPEKDKAYRLAVAERDFTSPAPGTLPSATPTPTAVPTVPPGGQPNFPNGPTALTPPPVGSGLDSGSLPPERIAFQATAATLTLRANRPTVFALYVVAPAPSPSPSPSPKSTVTPTAAPVAPSASPSPSPSASP
jgi:hypothetical protein